MKTNPAEWRVTAIMDRKRFRRVALSKNRGFRQHAPNRAAAALHAKFMQGVALHQQGKLAEAARIFEEVLRQQPNNFAALHLLGVIAAQTRRTERAVELLRKAIGVNAKVAAAHSNLGIALRNLKRLDEALASYDKAIALKPDYAEAYSSRGTALHDLKRPEEALASYNKAISLKPDYAEAHNNRANTLLDLKRPEEALASYDRAIALKPGYAEAHNNRGSALHGLKRPEEALASYDKAIALKPDYAEAYGNRAIVLHELKCRDKALASYDKAIALKPDYAEAYSNRGNALQELKRPGEALASCDQAIALKPDYAEAYCNRGTALHDLKRPKDALASYDKAIALKPNYAEAYNNRGSALLDLNRPDEALASYDRAIALKPDYAEAYGNRAIALHGLKRPEEALANYDKAIALKPDYAEAYSNRGNALTDLKRLDEALASYDRAIARKPDLADVEGLRLHTKMHLCDWSNFDNECVHLISAVRNGKGNTPPFPFLAIPSSFEDQLQCAKLYIANKYPPSDRPIWQGERYNHERIRLAYLSADFRQHPVAQLMAGVFECHDKSRFDVTAISITPNDHSEMRKRLKAVFEHFIDAETYSDDRIANLVRELEVDILLDLAGFTTDSRTGIFARRCAPIQVNYLGYPGTMGAPYIDYIMADRIVIPEDQHHFYSEKIVCLPNCFVPRDSTRIISDRLYDRAQLGLPQSGFVFCCFNNSYKINPSVFDCWMRILKKVEGSVLWLSENNTTATANLRKEAGIRGINPARLVFAKRMPLLADHLARHRLADLFLDTLPYNAHTTASDALWAGLPVLTCRGQTFASRVAASLLTAIRLPELITMTVEDYESLAIELARQPEKLAIIKRKLTDNRLTTPLFDTKLFTKHIEAAYMAMYERHQADLMPDDIVMATKSVGPEHRNNIL